MAPAPRWIDSTGPMSVTVSDSICGKPRRQRRADFVGAVMVVDVVHGDARAALTDDLGDPVDHRRVRLGDRADPLIQHQPAVDVQTQQRLERQRGAQPRRGRADPAAAPQVVQPVDDDERVATRHRRTGRSFNGIQIRPRRRRLGGCAVRRTRHPSPPTAS